MPFSSSSKCLYIVYKLNNEYNISATKFVCTSTSTNYIFQMLKDTYFNIITTSTSDVEFEIISFQNIGTDSILNADTKLAILDYLNNGKFLENCSIKSILTFKSPHIGNNIKNNTLYINSSHLEINFMVNKLPKSDQLYISNPTFEIDKNYLNNLLVK